MKSRTIIITLLLLLIASAGWNVRQASVHRSHGQGEKTTAETPGQLWTCGMHPTVIQDHPGNCPICGMKLTPMSGSSPTTIAVDPSIVQSIGVRTAQVERRTIRRTVRANGVVAVDETRQHVVSLKYSGWIEKLYADKTGAAIRRGERLFDLYSPMLVTAMQEYLLAFHAAKISNHAKTGSSATRSLEAARRKLLHWDISEEQIRELESDGVAPHRITVHSPASGTILEKNVTEGEAIMEGMNLYRIADLSRVWVTAQLYEYELPWIAEGQTVTITPPHDPGRAIEGRIDYLYPYLDPDTRTATVRVEVPNPDLSLKPDMYVTLDVQSRTLENALTVPREAVIRSGRRDIVFVTSGKGKFEPREIEVGLEADDFLFEVRSGLQDGERIVTSAQFLLDSETQIQEALHKLMAGGGSPSDLPAPAGHAAHGVGAAAKTRRNADPVAEGGTMEQLYEASPLQWCPMHHDIVSAEENVHCPLCEMNLKPLAAAELATLRASGPYGCVMCPVVVPGEDKDKHCPICEMQLKPIKRPQ